MERPTRPDVPVQFHLNRLEFALARRLNPASQLYRDLIDRSILSLYKDCVAAGGLDAARDLIERYRSGARGIR